jgi:hypothetical protein
MDLLAITLAHSEYVKLIGNYELRSEDRLGFRRLGCIFTVWCIFQNKHHLDERVFDTSRFKTRWEEIKLF